MARIAATSDTTVDRLVPLLGPSARRDNTVRPLVDFTCLSTATSDQKAVRAAHQVYEHLIGLWAPAVIETAHELGVFDHLARVEAATAQQVADVLGTDRRATRVLLDGLLAYGILQRLTVDGVNRYWLAAEFRGALLPGGLFSVSGKIAHDRNVAWDAWRRLGDAVRTGTNEVNQISEENYKDLVGGINFWGPPIVDVIAAALTEARWHIDTPVSLLDVGCGTGLYSQLLLQRFPNWVAEGIDAPGIVGIADAQADQLGVADRFTGKARDFWRDGWGEVVDLVLFVNIFHLQPVDAARDLMARAARVLAEDGVICIADQIVLDESDPVTPQDRFALLFAASMLATGGGDTYSVDRYDDWLADAGLRRLAVLDTPMHRVLLAGHAGRDAFAQYGRGGERR